MKKQQGDFKYKTSTIFDGNMSMIPVHFFDKLIGILALDYERIGSAIEKQLTDDERVLLHKLVGQWLKENSRHG